MTTTTTTTTTTTDDNNVGKVEPKAAQNDDNDDDDDDEIASLCKVASHNFDAEVSTVILSKKGILQRVTQDGDVLWEIDLEDTESMGGGWFDVSFVDPELVCLSKLGAIMTVDVFATRSASNSSVLVVMRSCRRSTDIAASLEESALDRSQRYVTAEVQTSP